jgi:hypothetical protein
MKEAEKITNTYVLYTYEVSAYWRRELYIRFPVFIRIANCQSLVFFSVLIFTICRICYSQF